MQAFSWVCSDRTGSTGELAFGVEKRWAIQKPSNYIVFFQLMNTFIYHVAFFFSLLCLPFPSLPFASLRHAPASYHISDWMREKKLGLISRQSQNNGKIEVDKQRAFGGWRSCFVRCNIIWTRLVLLPPVGLGSFCWHFAVICTLQSGPFSPHQKCFYARVSGCLWCLPSAPVREREQGLCSGAEGGRLLCALSVFSEGENWLKGCQRTWKHTSIHTHTHTHTHQQAVFSLSAALPVRTKYLKWTRNHKAHAHTGAHTMLITPVFLPAFVFLKGYRNMRVANAALIKECRVRT